MFNYNKTILVNLIQIKYITAMVLIYKYYASMLLLYYSVNVPVCVTCTGYNSTVKITVGNKLFLVWSFKMSYRGELVWSRTGAVVVSVYVCVHVLPCFFSWVRQKWSWFVTGWSLSLYLTVTVPSEPPELYEREKRQICIIKSKKLVLILIK